MPQFSHLEIPKSIPSATSMPKIMFTISWKLLVLHPKPASCTCHRRVLLRSSHSQLSHQICWRS